MRRLTNFVCITTCIILFFQEISSAQLHNGNLHRTVTHSPDRGAINRFNGSENAARHTNAQESVMGEKFGQYKNKVEAFKGAMEIDLAEKGSAETFGLHVRSKIKNWREDDYVKLATSVNGVIYFQDLIEMSSAAIVKTYDGKPTDNAICAQNALKALKPDCCKDVQEFSELITKVRYKTNAKMNQIFKDFPELLKGEVIWRGDRNKKGYGALDMPNLSKDIAVNEQEPTLDQAQRTIAEKTSGGESAKLIFDEKNLNTGLAQLQSKGAGRNAA